jgi:hypothetical protein
MAGFSETMIGILAGLGGVVGIRAGTEEPRFTVVEHVGAVEIRHYGPRLAAETTVSGSDEAARNEGFRKVAAYIFGGNTAKSSIAMTAPVAQSAASEKIAMTAPVAQTAGGPGAWRIQFFMPARYTRHTLPTPLDPSVRIVEVPAQDFAVLRFSGSRTGPAVSARQKELAAAIASSPWRANGEPSAWFYDPPWTPPFLRRNEVATPVVRQD